ncbi:hypothetical protein [Aurantiacibacter marinus]|uniref:TonB C-terminal domain-containing protein n=1 Tax=Aurantiacibacter marinus TaxID=874156 RepID=A0A0H0XMU1_9SPHN|nr:hypothetical protein [Aurantiacibacter marinus]KLI63893.1 hypothetical protein AAV99_09365 [Aurantiacibacter marinus]
MQTEEQRSGRRKVTWIVLGLIAATAMAVFGGMMLGEFAGLSQGEVKAVSSSGEVASTVSSGLNDPSPNVEEALPVADELPAISIATSLSPSSGVRAIGAGQWIGQDDLPRELFRGETVSGMIAAYLTVRPEGSVSACTVSNSSEVDPARFLRPAAVGVCRALRERAQFEPFANQPGSTPIARPVIVTADQQDKQQGEVPPTDAETQMSVEPQAAQREVLVRVVFRTDNGPASSASIE